MVDNVAVVDRGGNPPGTTRGVSTSRPSIANSNIYNVEITSKFRSAATRLRAGTLIKDVHFTLFESVGALEIGDPKMDSGCHETEDLDQGFDVTKSLTPMQVLWLMDELLCREVAWQMGHPLSQTLFTSYHIDSLLWPDILELSDAQFGRQPSSARSEPIVHLVFRAYCLALVKCCDLSLTMITSQHYYEEEDFATQLFNRELLRRFAVEDIMVTILEATTWLNTAVIEMDVKNALLTHIKFRTDLLQALKQHSAMPPQSMTIHALSLDNLCLHQVQRQPVSGAFSPKIQQRLASSVPPRPMITIDIKRALQFWDDACRQMTDAFSVRAAQCSTDLLIGYLLFNAQEPHPSTYVRTLLQSFLSEQGKVCGRYSMLDFMWDDFRRLTLTSSPFFLTITRSSQHLASHHRLSLQHCKEFISRIEVSYTNVYRTFCLNRSRLRRTLHHALLEWDQIQAEAEELDEEIQRLTGEKAHVYISGTAPTFSYPLSSWIYHLKLTQVRLLIQMGFELCVYAPHELSGMYWYLAYICDIHLAHLERICHFVAIAERNIPASMQGTVAEDSILEECHKTTDILYRNFSTLKATQELARALHGCYTVVDRHNGHLSAKATYSADELRYEIRMRPFLHLSIPDPIHFAQFRNLTQLHHQNDNEVLKIAADYAQSARRDWEALSKLEWHSRPLFGDEGDDSGVIKMHWDTDVKSSVKASIASGLAINHLQRKLSGSREGDPKHQIRLDIPKAGDRDYWHPFWNVPRLS